MQSKRPSNYWDYLGLDKLLTLQDGFEADESALAPDELHFIVVHQAYELWLKLILRELRMADGLGGKGYLLFGGPVAEVEAAVSIGSGRVPGELVRETVIAQLHQEMLENLSTDGRFERRVRPEEA